MHEQVRLLPGADPDELIAEAKERWNPVKTLALFSGGGDSSVVAHRCREHYDSLMFIDTGTALPTVDAKGRTQPPGRPTPKDGIQGVEDFVSDYAKWIGKPVRVYRAGNAYREMVVGNDLWHSRFEASGLDSIEAFGMQDREVYGQREGVVRSGPHKGFDLGRYPWGFPGRAQHGKTYSRLKERQIEAALAHEKEGLPRDANVLFVSGIRRDESARRSKREPLTERGGAKFVNPLIDFTTPEMRRYREEHALPQSEISKLIHRSGECNCASGGDWADDRALIKTLWPQWFHETIEALEAEAERLGLRWCRWGGYDLDGIQAGGTDEDEEVGLLCSNCPTNQLVIA